MNFRYRITRHFFTKSAVRLALLLLPAPAYCDAPAQSGDLAPKKTDDGIVFQCSAPGASAAYLAGDFNSWVEANNGAISEAKYKMDGPDENGLWHKAVTLTPGEHKFKFCIGGTAEGWFAPGWAKKDSEGNALITIAEDGSVAGAGESTLAAENNAEHTVTFHFTAPDAKYATRHYDGL